RHGDDGVEGAPGGADVGDHARLDVAARVGDLDLDGERAALRVDGRADERDPALELPALEHVEGDPYSAAAPDITGEPLGDAAHHLDRIRVHDARDRRARRDHAADLDEACIQDAAHRRT